MRLSATSAHAVGGDLSAALQHGVQMDMSLIRAGN